MQMTHGEVTVWYMTEQQRLDYIEKHPIIPTEKPTGSSFSNLHEYGQRAKGIDRRKGASVDNHVRKEIHKRFLAGEDIGSIAESLGMKRKTLDQFIWRQRKSFPNQWPYRKQKEGAEQ